MKEVQPTGKAISPQKNIQHLKINGISSIFFSDESFLPSLF
jgi:hypothetical protein